MLVEQFIRASVTSPFEIRLQEMHKQDVAFSNINVHVFYTAFFLSLTSLMEHGEIGKKFGVSNVVVKILTNEAKKKQTKRRQGME